MKGLPGFRDFYPEPIPTADSWSLDLRRYIFDTWRGTAERYGF
ncbi:MAG: histidine--tRNA ligase, partial [Verrucomicrobia bacterium]|nr:histidine--tRNA ligase [Verrucomicrobiota bacterium]